MPAEQAVGERDQGDEGEHHRADRDGEPDAGLRALGGGHDDVGRPLALLERLGDLDLLLGRLDAAVERKLVLARLVGHDDLGHQDSARRRHEGGGEQGRQILRAEQLA